LTNLQTVASIHLHLQSVFGDGEQLAFGGFMKVLSRILFSMCGVLLASVPALAHHSFTAEFDDTKAVTLSGTISRVEWVNPHMYVYLDVKDPSGQITTWGLESLPPTALRAGGMTKSSFPIGAPVTVLGWCSKSGKPVAYLRKVTFSDGHVLQVGRDPTDPSNK
jgi:Family of unknown function (DUF6152)